MKEPLKMTLLLCIMFPIGLLHGRGYISGYDDGEYSDDDDDDDDEDNFFKWYDGYKKRKAQKAAIREGLMSIVWHPSRWWD